MADFGANEHLKPSLLDRLIDPDSKGTKAQWGYTLEQTIEAVKRDLEELLNTRLPVSDLPESLPELRSSVLVYGLPDLISLNGATPQQRDEISRALEAAVARFEPRLRDVRATPVEAGEAKDRKVRFRIEGRLCVDPAPEVVFDTVLELTTGQYSVSPTQES